MKNITIGDNYLVKESISNFDLKQEIRNEYSSIWYDISYSVTESTDSISSKIRCAVDSSFTLLSPKIQDILPAHLRLYLYDSTLLSFFIPLKLFKY